MAYWLYIYIPNQSKSDPQNTQWLRFQIPRIPTSCPALIPVIEFWGYISTTPYYPINHHQSVESGNSGAGSFMGFFSWPAASLGSPAILDGSIAMLPLIRGLVQPGNGNHDPEAKYIGISLRLGSIGANFLILIQKKQTLWRNCNFWWNNQNPRIREKAENHPRIAGKFLGFWSSSEFWKITHIFPEIAQECSRILGFLVSRFLGFSGCCSMLFYVVLGFSVSRFLGFSVSRILGFSDSRFLGFSVSRLYA